MIWCVEDDSDIRDIEVYALNSTGLCAKGFEDGSSCLAALQSEIPDLIILDVMLPGISGVDLLTKLKNSPMYNKIPVIMATAKGTEYDKIQSLDLGADDYLVKPFGVMELLSRVKAVLRRCSSSPSLHILRSGDLTVNLDEHTVSIAGQRIHLTFKEYELLRLLLSRPGMAYTREQLFSQVWNTDYMGDSRTLDMHIRTLRQKLGVHGSSIETVRSIGYRWRGSDG